MAGNRTYYPREMKMLSEWVAENYENAEVHMNARVGSLHPRLQGKFLSESELRMAGVFRRYADAIIILPSRVIIVEAAIRPQPGKVSQLEMYGILFPNTPDMEEHSKKPVELVLLVAIEDPVISIMARRRDMRVVHYEPKWLPEYLAKLYPRERTATLTTLEK